MAKWSSIGCSYNQYCIYEGYFCQNLNLRVVSYFPLFVHNKLSYQYQNNMIHLRKNISTYHHHPHTHRPTQNNQKIILNRSELDPTAKRMKSDKDIRLRQNYIINKDHIYASLQGQFKELANKPEFNRFISHKKSQYLPKNETHIATEIIKNHQTTDRLQLSRSGGRRKLLFMKMRRPQHNSPIKRGLKQQQIDRTYPNVQSQAKKTRKTLLGDNQNSMMIKQMVTRVQQSRKGRAMSSNPYGSSSSANRYYVSEAVKGYKIKDSLVRDHLFNSIYFLQLLSKYNNTTDFGSDKPITLPQKQCYKNKISVIFDLDETLVHCFQELSQPHQIEIPVTFPGNYKMLAPINIRPFAREVLTQLAKEFQLMVFTASHQAYANAVIEYLDPKKQLIQHRLFRRHCDYIEQGYYVKDLRLLGRDLAKLVLVDNAAYSYAFQVNNGIPIVPYYEGESDFELKALKQYLLSLRQCRDVRVRNKQAFKLQKYIGCLQVQDVVQTLYLCKRE